MLYMKNENYTDADLTFSMKIYNDIELGKWCLGNVRRSYPNARVIVISDGDPNLKPSDLLEYNVEFIPSVNLYSLESGGKMIQRMIETFMRSPTEYLLKIDTDTGVHRRFKWLPRGYGLFGQLQHDNYLCSIQGGFIGMHYDLARDIYLSGICESVLLKDCGSTYALSPFVNAHCVSRGKVCEDFMLGYIVSRLNAPIFGFDEVKCAWKDYFANEGEKYAITHPCKEMKL